MDDSLVKRFAKLHSGLDIAFGTGKGQWVKRPPTLDDFKHHLMGVGHGIGIAPLRPDSTVLFAAIDLDEPDFDAAKEMQEYLPGVSFVERSRSGNAHIWVYFASPIPAWVPMGILKEATFAAGKDHVEVFPKNWNFERVKLGNYINLPYHGTRRWVHQPCDHPHDHMEMPGWEYLTLEMFLDKADANLNDPKDWQRRAEWMQIYSPELREATQRFGEKQTLHCCALHVLENQIPITEGTRQYAFFALAKMFTNWAQCDHDEALDYLREINSWSDSIPDNELQRILGNVERGEYTSTGCDDPLFADYRSPECHIG